MFLSLCPSIWLRSPIPTARICKGLRFSIRRFWQAARVRGNTFRSESERGVTVVGGGLGLIGRAVRAAGQSVGSSRAVRTCTTALQAESQAAPSQAPDFCGELCLARGLRPLPREAQHARSQERINVGRDRLTATVTSFTGYSLQTGHRHSPLHLSQPIPFLHPPPRTASTDCCHDSQLLG